MNPIEFLKSNSKTAEVIRFGIVGGIATLLQYLFYILFAEVVGISAVVATPISYVLSFVVNFILTTYFTFRTRPSTLRGIGFTLSHAVNMGLQTLLVALFLPLTGKAMALLPAMIICIPVNFLLIRFVFKSNLFKSKTNKTSNNS